MASTLLAARIKRNRECGDIVLVMFPGIFVALFVVVVLVMIARELLQSPKGQVRSSKRRFVRNRPEVAPHVQDDHRHTGTYNGHNPSNHPGGHHGGHHQGGHGGGHAGGHGGGGHAGGGGHGGH